jgi:hypothetical protein
MSKKRCARLASKSRSSFEPAKALHASVLSLI